MTRRRRVCLAINDLNRAGAETRYGVHILVLKHANAFPVLAERGIP